MDIHWLIAFCLGIGLSAACGIRMFLPLLLIAVNQRFHLLDTSYHVDWLDSNLALIILITATVIEISAYYIPLIDHILDVVNVPLVFVAGLLSMASILPDMPLYMDKVLGLIVGGSTAVTINGLVGIGRLKSTTLSAGTTNPFYATIENVMTIVITVLSFLIPIIIGLIVFFVVLVSFKKFRNFFRKPLSTKH
ncbi:MAG TPA: DUF4126 domain-containing protein [Saprospiraceae bacterium]|nr:DUF4126 domain-containing protein [Saprospiraceae bacterium]HQW55454.1 DUF4126 domain-containing protein [Saprospiraceae bacterium]